MNTKRLLYEWNYIIYRDTMLQQVINSAVTMTFTSRSRILKYPLLSPSQMEYITIFFHCHHKVSTFPILQSVVLLLYTEKFFQDERGQFCTVEYFFYNANSYRKNRMIRQINMLEKTMAFAFILLNVRCISSQTCIKLAFLFTKI